MSDTAFHLSSVDREFNSRVDALFSSLQTAETNLEPLIKDNKYEGDDSRDNLEEGAFKRPSLQDNTGRDNFKRPKGNPSSWRSRPVHGQNRFRPHHKTPDYVKNPEAWTCYSIKSTKVLSDFENKNEGLKLMEELKTRRLEGEASELKDEDSPVCNESTENKIVFKKPTMSSKNIQNDALNDEDNGETSSQTQDRSLDAIFGGTRKLVQKEYEVGKSKIKTKTKANKHDKEDGASKKTSKEVKLSYLQFEDDEVE